VPSPLVAAMSAPRSAGSIDRALREAGAILGPVRDRRGQDSPPPGSGGPGTPHRTGVPLLGAPRRRPILDLHHPPAARCSRWAISTPGLSVGEVVLVEQSRPELRRCSRWVSRSRTS
jgi:hypothetical protein